MTRRGSPQRGISLVEALVALAVLGFGLMAYVGVQSTLRINGDLARQRAEATRIGQDVIENWRSFHTLRADPGRPDPSQPDPNAFDSIASADPQEVRGLNATYTVERSVVADAALGHKTVVVDVRWRDRTDAWQSLRFASVVAAVAPDLAGTLAVPGGGARRVAGRHPAIPLDAVPAEGGRSRLPIAQPDGSVATLVFDDSSGLITSLCTQADRLQAERCVPTTALLLSGHVRYATTPGQPTPADAEFPPGPAQPPVAVEVRLTAPSTTTIACVEQVRPLDIRYFCALPITLPPAGAIDVTDTLGRWSGRVALSGLPLAEEPPASDPPNPPTDARADRFRVCRYTPHRDHRPVDSGTPPMRNADTPLDYLQVRTPLTNQNFLVIRAGDGSQAFECPDDDPATEFINGRTWRHQPE